MNLNDVIYELTEIQVDNKPRLLNGRNGYVYYLRITYNNIIYYKIGFTGRAVEERIRKLFPITGTDVDIIDMAYFDVLAEAYKMEQLLHRIHAEHKFKYSFKLHGRKFLGSGITEVYIKDVLGLDNGLSMTKKKIGYRWNMKTYNI